METLYALGRAACQHFTAYFLTFALAGWLSWQVWVLGRDTDQNEALVWIGVIFAIELSKVQSVRVLVRGWQWGTFALCLALFAGSVANDLLVFARKQEAHVARTSGAAQRNEKAEARRSELKEELAALGEVRSAAELVPLVQAAEKLAEKAAGDCSKAARGEERDACKSLPLLRSEAARAKRADELRSRLDTLDAKPEETGASAEAKALAGLARALGWTVAPERAETVMLFARLLLFQLMSSLAGFSVPKAGGAGRDQPVHGRKPANARQMGLASVQPADQPPPLSTRELVVERLRLATDQTLTGGRSKLAKQLGITERQYRTVIDQLVSEGLVEMRTGSQGTVLKLIEEAELDG